MEKEVGQIRKKYFKGKFIVGKGQADQAPSLDFRRKPSFRWPGYYL
jgi:hypothetical protein